MYKIKYANKAATMLPKLICQLPGQPTRYSIRSLRLDCLASNFNKTLDKVSAVAMHAVLTGPLNPSTEQEAGEPVKRTVETAHLICKRHEMVQRRKRNDEHQKQLKKLLGRCSISNTGPRLPFVKQEAGNKSYSDYLEPRLRDPDQLAAELRDKSRELAAEKQKYAELVKSYGELEMRLMQLSQLQHQQQRQSQLQMQGL